MTSKDLAALQKKKIPTRLRQKVGKLNATRIQNNRPKLSAEVYALETTFWKFGISKLQKNLRDTLANRKIEK